MRRKQKPLFLIEGGVPGNIDPAVSKLSNLFLYDLNDLEQIFQFTKKTKTMNLLIIFLKTHKRMNRSLIFLKY